MARVGDALDAARAGALPLVADAGALAALPERLAPWIVLTPHAGELARLLDDRGERVSRPDVEAEPLRWARRAHELTGATVLLKGHRTLIGAPEERVAINATGSGVLATGGSGDVLTGILAGFGTQLDARRAAYSAAYLHGIAGERRSGNGVDRGVLAHEIADELPHALGALRAEAGSRTLSR